MVLQARCLIGFSVQVAFCFVNGNRGITVTPRTWIGPLRTSVGSSKRRAGTLPNNLPRRREGVSECRRDVRAEMSECVLIVAHHNAGPYPAADDSAGGAAGRIELAHGSKAANLSLRWSWSPSFWVPHAVIVTRFRFGRETVRAVPGLRGSCAVRTRGGSEHRPRSRMPDRCTPNQVTGERLLPVRVVW